MASEFGANAPSSPSFNSAESYIGSFISLISKFEIRYEGVLYILNLDDSTIGLKNVRSYGTEGRRKDGPQVPPSEKVYEYILFRGNDIKNLQVKSPSTSAKPEEKNFRDPAIIQSQYSGVLSSPVAPAGGRSLTESIQRQDCPAISSRAFPVGLASHQSVTQPAPSNLSAATQVASHPSFSTAMYWQGHSGTSSNSSHSLLKSSSLQPPLMATSLAVQNKMPNAETQVPAQGGWAALSESGLPVSSVTASSLVNLTPSPPLSSLKLFDSPDFLPLLSTKTPMPYSASMTFDGSNMPQFSSPLQDINSITQLSGNICPDPRPIHPRHSVDHSASSFVDSTSGPLPTALPLFTPDELAHVREQLFTYASDFNFNQKDMGSLSLTSSGSSALMPSPASQAPLLPLPTVVQKPQYTAPQFTEEFDFEAMNEKFKKDEVWGSLGKATINIEGVQQDNAFLSSGDRECHGMIQNPKSAYKKDDFFDTISCNSLTRGSRNGQNRFSERMKVDTETFGNFQQRPNFSHGGYGAGRGVNFRGSYNWGRGYSYNGRGRGPNFPF
ncbi:decapping 5-like protein [Cajanus cajan]|uniref:decapping 5-like protein n=1 Tax=Cajanus cajan TaxID=3821 RepID=UPI00098DABAC|nr:decapping 5-like protein [Cajanus cajan]